MGPACVLSLRIQHPRGAMPAGARALMPARSLVVARPWGTGARKAGAPNAKRTVRARAADGAQVADGSVVQLASPEDFEKVVAEATAQNKLLCTMVSTRTCGPCKLVYPKFVKLADAYDGVVFAKSALRLPLARWTHPTHLRASRTPATPPLRSHGRRLGGDARHDEGVGRARGAAVPLRCEGRGDGNVHRVERGGARGGAEGAAGGVCVERRDELHKLSCSAPAGKAQTTAQ